MLSSVLRSKRAVQVNIEIMRAFVRLREIISTHTELALKPGKLRNPVLSWSWAGVLTTPMTNSNGLPNGWMQVSYPDLEGRGRIRSVAW
ncbi:MAG: hypothetical protein R6X27_10860 [Candidatus Desulfacyla sp.]